MDSSKSNIYIQKKEDGSITLSFYTDEPIVKRISIVFPKRTTKDELLKEYREEE